MSQLFWDSDVGKALPPKPERTRVDLITVSGDGLLRLVPLMMAGLIDPGERRYDFDTRSYSWSPRLSALGMSLARAWLAGDADGVRGLLRGFQEPQPVKDEG